MGESFETTPAQPSVSEKERICPICDGNGRMPGMPRCLPNDCMDEGYITCRACNGSKKIKVLSKKAVALPAGVTVCLATASAITFWQVVVHSVGMQLCPSFPLCLLGSALF